MARPGSNWITSPLLLLILGLGPAAQATQLTASTQASGGTHAMLDRHLWQTTGEAVVGRVSGSTYTLTLGFLTGVAAIGPPPLQIAITSHANGAVLGPHATNGRFSLLHGTFLAAGGLIGGGASSLALVTMVGDPVGIAAPRLPDPRAAAPRRVRVDGALSEPAAFVMVNGTPAVVTGTRFHAEGVALSQGRNQVTVTATDAAGRSTHHTITVVVPGGPYPPRPTLEPPATVVTNPSLTLQGTKISGTAIWVSLEDAYGIRGQGQEIVGRNQARTWEATIQLTEGDNSIILTARNDKLVDYESAPAEALVVLDRLPPVISPLRFLAPDGQTLNRDPSTNAPKTNLDRVILEGAVDDSLTRVEAHGVTDAVPGRAFRVTLPLAVVGSHPVTLAATSPTALVSTVNQEILRGTIPTITALTPADRRKVYVQVPLMIQAAVADPEGDPVVTRLVVDGTEVLGWASATSHRWTPATAHLGAHAVEVQAKDDFGGSSSTSSRLFVVRKPVEPQ